MGSRVHLLVLVFCIQVFVTAADTNSQDYAALVSLTSGWANAPSSWSGSDPCGSWEGVSCTGSRITSITWSSLNLTGQLSSDLVSLTELQTLDLSYNSGLKGSIPTDIGALTQLTTLILAGCGFSGNIPDSIGSLQQLVVLALNSNGFGGTMPSSIGNLTNLYWLDVSDNEIEGSIPVSNGTVHGLDLLVNAKHFHFGQNKLSGTIPSGVFSSRMTLIHALFDNNLLTGSIPSTLGLVQTLEAVRFDRNLLDGTVPSNINNLTNLNELLLSNNKLRGSLPDLSGMASLNYVDMSNNSFNSSKVPSWFTTLTSMTTLMMENTSLQGSIPSSLFSLSQLQTLILSHNNFSGTLAIATNYSSQLQLVDLQNNSISEFTPTTSYNFTLLLAGDPYCTGSGATGSYCTIQTIQQQSNSSYSTPANNCVSATCSSGQTSSPNCKCAYPYAGTLIFRAASFSNLGNSSYYVTLQDTLMQTFQNLSLPVDSVSISEVNKNSLDYLNMLLEMFPSGQVAFNETGITTLGFVFSNQTYKPPLEYGPYVFIAQSYAGFEALSGQSKSSNSGVIIGAVVGGLVLVILIVLLGLYAFKQKKRADTASEIPLSFGGWDANRRNSDIQLKGARWFSFEEIKKCTSDFSDANIIGAGGYGKVYKGVLADGEVVAIKRAQAGSLQGTMEFKTEIELLSRVHHKNLVNLVGFCSDLGEQMLVYEFLPNGTLMDSLSGKSGIHLDWIRRLSAGLGAARGLAYLHEHADPPVIHRDIKTNNILLDERLTAKVADFGLCKLASIDKSYVTTQVKGTMGYLDPEYYMTQQLTEKSDVYSFGVVMLELVTGRRPIQQGGKYIVREVISAMNKTVDLYDLQGIIDPAIGSETKLVGFERFVDLALRCVEETSAKRPRMSEVVKEIESIMQMAGLNPNAESIPTSTTFEVSSGENIHNLYGGESGDSLFEYSGSIPSSKIEAL